MKKAWKSFVTSFKPRYSVVFTMYHVIPGLPVKRDATRHDFNKGEFEKAKSMFDKLVHKTTELRFAPAEVHLVKGKKKVIQRRQFGPVKDLRIFKMSA